MCRVGGAGSVVVVLLGGRFLCVLCIYVGVCMCVKCKDMVMIAVMIRSEEGGSCLLSVG